MQYLGIDKSSGLIYQGHHTYGACVVWPTPVVTPVSFVSSGDKEAKPVSLGSMGYAKIIFREDSFDPIARIRRGRFYSINAGPTEEDWWVIVTPPVHAHDDELNKSQPHLARKRTLTYNPFRISVKISEAKDDQLLVSLGTDRASSLWVIVNVETTHADDELVTLKARQSFGTLPEIDWEKVPDNGQANIREALQTLADDYHIASPESVVDRSNEAATRILNTYLQFRGKALQDSLHKIIVAMKDLGGEEKKEVARNAADIVRLLHGRTKYAVQKMHNARTIREQDAELSIQCIGVMLCDLGWGSWM